ncbi:hypothetical protein BS78_03G235500 [Paspalum vaginatum]|nr:hypothetical protein BS78_03G235500 [Paspalum vaginatum]
MAFLETPLLSAFIRPATAGSGRVRRRHDRGQGIVNPAQQPALFPPKPRDKAHAKLTAPDRRRPAGRTGSRSLRLSSPATAPAGTSRCRARPGRPSDHIASPRLAVRRRRRSGPGPGPQLLADNHGARAAFPHTRAHTVPLAEKQATAFARPCPAVVAATFPLPGRGGAGSRASE